MLFSENVEKFLRSIGRNDLTLVFKTDAVRATVNSNYAWQMDIAINVLHAVFDDVNIDDVAEEVNTYVGDFDCIDLFDIQRIINNNISKGFYN